MEKIFFILIALSFILLFIKKYNNAGLKLMIFVILILIILNPNVSLNSAKDGLNLFLYTVFPSLFPFFIINDLLMSVGIAENIAIIFNKPINRIFKTSGYGAYAFIISIFSGYPAGAKVVKELIEAKKISPKEGERILTFSSTSGPLFIIGAVGAGMLKSNLLGYILYASHIIASVLNGIICNLFSKREKKDYIYEHKNTILNLNNSIKNSLITMGFISGYIIFFSVIINLLDTISFFNIISVILSKLFKVNSDDLSIFIKSLFEMSNGCKLIVSSSISNKLLVISFILSFSGISILYQVKGVLYGCNVSFKKYILSKINHGILSSIVCYYICKIINVDTIMINYSLNLNNLFVYSATSLLILIFILNTIYFLHKKKTTDLL
ncbi:MAG: hypothetical protein JG776_1520 [Caloramator sp.]|jgi:sporulation integral membrane protein YlbJ|uniref:hypothetical protein n=1 Tax=Caloramator sp. TaxID=1871330 RepID=UPI001D8EDB45|nr:hypothetical protein [Caloramator sp.]MBZ4663805.1 hypothetical protein [Caloramator sp.]